MTTDDRVEEIEQIVQWAINMPEGWYDGNLAYDAATRIIEALDAEPDHFYLATFRDVDNSQVTDDEPRYCRQYTIIDGPAPTPMDAWDGGWLSDEEWDRAVVLGFKGTRAVAAYYDHDNDTPVTDPIDGLDVTSAQDALHERVSALDAEPPLEDVLREATWVSSMEVDWCEDDDRGWFEADLYGYVDGRGVIVGCGTGPTIDAAIRKAIQSAKEQG